MDDYTEKLNKIKSTISNLKSDLNDKSKVFQSLELIDLHKL